ncbi:hypothetical protein C8R45DRAFT_1073196 [Mycena sanguinolenta]|nr:hypothetical protein C8R45DRAFT_1073196 [Mycena sanguinolenta]
MSRRARRLRCAGAAAALSEILPLATQTQPTRVDLDIYLTLELARPVDGFFSSAASPIRRGEDVDMPAPSPRLTADEEVEKPQLWHVRWANLGSPTRRRLSSKAANNCTPTVAIHTKPVDDDTEGNHKVHALFSLFVACSTIEVGSFNNPIYWFTLPDDRIESN